MISTVHNDLIFSPLLYLQTQIYEMIFSRSQSCPMVRSMQQAMEAKPTLFLNTLITATLTKVRSEGIKILKIRKKKKLQKVIDGYFKSSNKVWLNSCKVLNFKLSYLWLFINHLIIKTFMMLLLFSGSPIFFPLFLSRHLGDFSLFLLHLSSFTLCLRKRVTSSLWVSGPDTSSTSPPSSTSR